MEKKVLMALAMAALMVACVIAYAVLGATNGDQGELEQPEYEMISFYFVVDGVPDQRVAEGSDLREIIESAMDDVRFNSAGQVSSVGGVQAEAGKKWVMWTWSNAEWSSIPSVTDDVRLFDGMNLALTLSDIVVENSSYSYSDPGFPILQKVWFFIKFVDDSQANSYVTSYLTTEEREAGFWVCGEGIDAVYALMDVADDLDWDLDMDMERTPRGWLNSFFGMSDENNALNGTWTYWSQYHWDGDRWVFNQAVLGGFDISEVRYFALVRQTTVENGADFTWDVSPDDIPPSLLE